jgi:hypothetical protein
MAARAILLFAFGAFLLSSIVRADDGPKFPSREASVVMPLLKQISRSDSPESVLSKIRQILGKPCFGESGGPRNRFTSVDYYFLDDKTMVVAGYLNGRFSGVSFTVPGQRWVLLYKVPNS